MKSNYGFGAIRSVQLVVDPPAVRRGQHATLRCLYDLDDSPLYSVKFYRGLREFYRYSPGQQPSKKIFPFPGINVDNHTGLVEGSSRDERRV
uniref:Ig-like domain-containing protein n=1 Tax=Anopheles dirus TaxID=7168 RepID=A0A182NCR8_9DIPT